MSSINMGSVRDIRVVELHAGLAEGWTPHFDETRDAWFYSHESVRCAVCVARVICCLFFFKLFSCCLAAALARAICSLTASPRVPCLITREMSLLPGRSPCLRPAR